MLDFDPDEKKEDFTDDYVFEMVFRWTRSFRTLRFEGETERATHFDWACPNSMCTQSSYRPPFDEIMAAC